MKRLILLKMTIIDNDLLFVKVQLNVTDKNFVHIHFHRQKPATINHDNFQIFILKAVSNFVVI